MVKLDNRYPAPRPPLSRLFALACVLVLGYLGFTRHYVSFAYQYALFGLAGLLICVAFDSDLLTARRLLGYERPFRKRHVLPAVTAGACVVIAVVTRLFYAHSPLYLWYRQSSISPVEYFIVIVLLVTVIEEIVFRGFVQRNLSDLVGSMAGFVMASILYGFYFLLSGNGGATVIFALVGAFTGFIYMKSGSVWLAAALRAPVMILVYIASF
ncbi:MAG: CPBP family intramembrane metalloprotease [Spirochaetes bacterium]|nr:MAG: CPBP family intramembrane metalloprotease [Spirochaetota bacterium]